MKTFQTTIVILLVSIFSISCSNDSDSEKQLIFENTTETAIADAIDSGDLENPTIPVTTISNIEIPKKGTILDLKKMVLEMNIEHQWQRDLSFTLIAPDGTESLFIYHVGYDRNYNVLNTLRFSAAFTTAMSNENSGNIDVPAGDYKESQGLYSFATPVLSPIFSTLQGKSITGIWKLKVTDNGLGGAGVIKSWKLIFEPGALKQ